MNVCFFLTLTTCFWASDCKLSSSEMMITLDQFWLMMLPLIKTILIKSECLNLVMAMHCI